MSRPDESPLDAMLDPQKNPDAPLPPLDIVAPVLGVPAPSRDRPPPLSGSLIYFEIPCQHVSRAKAFYKLLFDWSYQKTPEYSEWDYLLINRDKKHLHPVFGAFKKVDAPIAGAEGTGKDVEGPMLHFYVDNIEKACEEAVKVDGSVVRPKFKFGWEQDIIGYCAWLRDTEGNKFAIYEVEPHGPVEE
ncbi:uncharacterized protein SPPG_00143 [Spizellomyces punctatus DAOM BR117]|uniref:Glyoxalase/fosfomycin resistance/dioxygenase domain-containing protein n=1 Tax=Spizellomyces punctatus (strain DAOM BR117) TaxID=645134 RepID=A0A0L0HTG9_SPIPD|nr:uncharacterized protein SPPG_00143 [Spizellomyces punctatus DAOM BR117]KND04413.1 hypothetical protein SPPG_00143 [Spizellomyces punctatus DAOM BR117]|eukprot:XP_016612452.1 hypothetical protein SPPG_00143 [Spizellomyces punctatus DAOM BR117]